MRIHALAAPLAGLVTLLAAGSSPGDVAEPPRPLAFVSCEGSAEVWVVDLDTMLPVGDPIPVGLDPLGIDASPDGARVYVANRGGSLQPDESYEPSVSVIDVATRTVAGTVLLSPLDPRDLVVHPSGAKVYVACRNHSQVSVVDTATLTEVDAIYLSSEVAYPEAIDVSPDGAWIYAAGEDRIDVIRTSDDTVDGDPVMLPYRVRSLAVSADGTRVLLVGDDRPQVLDVATRTLRDTDLDDLGSQRDVAADGDFFYVTNTSWWPDVPTKALGGSSLEPGQSTVDVYRVSTAEYVGSIPIGLGQAYGIDVARGGARAVVTHKTAGTAGRVNLAEGTEDVIQAYVGSRPRRVALVEPAEAEEHVVSYFLPKAVVARVRGAGRDSLATKGFYDDGGAEVDYTQPVTLEVGGFSRTFTLVPKGNALVSPKDEVVKLKLLPNLKGSSRGKYQLRLRRTTLEGLVDPDGALDLHLRAANLPDAMGRVELSDGRYRLGRARGALLAPAFFPARTVARLAPGAKDTLFLKGGFATHGVTPSSLGSVRLDFGDGLARTIPGSAFTRRGDVFTYSERVDGRSLTARIDYLRETVLVKARGLELGEMADPVIDIVFGCGTQDLPVCATVRVAHKGSKRLY